MWFTKIRKSELKLVEEHEEDELAGDHEEHVEKRLNINSMFGRGEEEEKEVEERELGEKMNISLVWLW